MEWALLKELISSGADLGTLILLFLIYRLHMRVFAIEMKCKFNHEDD